MGERIYMYTGINKCSNGRRHCDYITSMSNFPSGLTFTLTAQYKHMQSHLLHHLYFLSLYMHLYTSHVARRNNELLSKCAD